MLWALHKGMCDMLNPLRIQVLCFLILHCMPEKKPFWVPTGCRHSLQQLRFAVAVLIFRVFVGGSCEQSGKGENKGNKQQLYGLWQLLHVDLLVRFSGASGPPLGHRSNAVC